ncbi:MAG: 4Fe-4S binding protein [Deltaproteobacteria bacterium]|nr:4Fe-4S binding protein [Deltaproteobacteria bacterium]MBW2044409.1 4Fe-4S binding protein [Deltaproteobacteria bacterium]
MIHIEGAEDINPKEREGGVKMSLETKMIGLTFKNPLLAGCAGITEWVHPVEKWLNAGAAGMVSKTITTDPKLRSSIRPTFYTLSKYGLKGAMVESELLSHYSPKEWAKEVAPRFKDLCEKHNARWIQSIVGRGAELDDWAELAQLVEAAGAEAIELDLGCPLAPGESDNYDEIELGESPEITAKLTAAVKKAVKIPVGVKLSPTIRRLDRIAIAAQKNGNADYCTAVNAPAGFHIDWEKEDIYGANTFVGYIPGPSLKWWGHWKVAQIKQACDLEVSGCGGIWTAGDAIQYILLGCPTVQMVSSVYFKGPKLFTDMLDGLKRFMDNKGYNSIDEFKGKVLSQIKTYKDIPHEKVMEYPSPIIAKVNTEKCTFCGQCATACIHDAIEFEKEKKICEVIKDQCIGCGFCAGLCPVNAISIVTKKDGRVVWSGEGRIDVDWINW